MMLPLLLITPGHEVIDRPVNLRHVLLHQFVQRTHGLIHLVTIFHPVKADIHPLTEFLHDERRFDAKHRKDDSTHPKER